MNNVFFSYNKIERVDFSAQDSLESRSIKVDYPIWSSKHFDLYGRDYARR